MRVLSGLLFYPRGGSSQVARALARALPEHGWDVTLLTGSGPVDAERFYAGLDVHAVDFLGGDAPMHPSYEDRPGAPDPIFAAVDEASFDRHVGAWAHALERAGAAEHDVLHLHHLTPLNEAAELVAPGVPVVGHLHGTELLMLEEIDNRPPAHWHHADEWAERIRAWAAACERLFVPTDGQVARAVRLLDVDPERFVVCPNGVDPEIFQPAAVDRAAHWFAHLGPAGARVARSVVLLAVGRFTAVKRLPLLIEAFTIACAHVRTPASLVLVGGHPGEVEGEHPSDAIRRTGARHVHLAGWHDHTALPAFFNAADAQVLASPREHFGVVLVEGMACAVPPIAVNRHGPAEIIEDGRTGWLVEPDDRDALARAIVACVDDALERRRRGRAAMSDVRERFAWPALAAGMAEVFDEVVSPTTAGTA